MTRLPIILGKTISTASRLMRRGNGSTWPGEVALRLNPLILQSFLPIVKKKIILVAGTNGKTTTSKMIVHILQQKEESGKRKVIYNPSGANLLNGLVSAFIYSADWSGGISADYAVLEVDEATLSQVLGQMDWKTIQPEKVTIVLLNLFRDQLDRYGEVDSIARRWEEYLTVLPKEVTLVLNADDPQIAYLGTRTKADVKYIGIDKPDQYLKTADHATDSTYCVNCGAKLSYKGIYFSHIGIWSCPSCGLKRPKAHVYNMYSPLPGLYNEYNTYSAAAAVESAGYSVQEITEALKDFTPAFGRQEELQVGSKTIKLFLSKNPAGFNASIRAVLDLKPTVIMMSLNDRIPDGRDVSWIWDVDFEMIPEKIKLIATGDRAYDMGVRLKYTGDWKYEERISVFEDVKEAINQGLEQIGEGETLFILATYSAMLEVRKIIKGRKIL
jgi:UDP-N-acetylmuramyl tripeptide synthase